MTATVRTAAVAEWMRANGVHMGCCASGSKHVSEYRRSQVEKDRTELSLGSYLLRHEQTGKTIQALYRSTCSNNMLCHSRRRYELHKKTPLSPDDGFKTFGGNFFFYFEILSFYIWVEHFWKRNRSLNIKILKIFNTRFFTYYFLKYTLESFYWNYFTAKYSTVWLLFNLILQFLH